MFLRSTAMATAVTLGGAAFIAGVATGAGLGLAAVGTACLARRAMKRRRDWGKDDSAPDDGAAIVASLAGGEEPQPG